MPSVRHKAFISYHHNDQTEVDRFVSAFDHVRDVFIYRGLGINGMESDIIDSNDPEYVMRRIRELYLQDTTVTIVLLGKCTWARRYVDWEIQSSLRQGVTTIPNGLLGIRLPSYSNNGYPNRLNLNLLSPGATECYARVINYPETINALSQWIEDACQARESRAHLIVNPRERFSSNKTCP